MEPVWVMKKAMTNCCSTISRSRNRSSGPVISGQAHAKHTLQRWVCVTMLSCCPFYGCALANLLMLATSEKDVIRYQEETNNRQSMQLELGLNFGSFSGLGSVVGLSGLKPLGMWKSGDCLSVCSDHSCLYHKECYSSDSPSPFLPFSFVLAPFERKCRNDYAFGRQMLPHTQPDC